MTLEQIFRRLVIGAMTISVALCFGYCIWVRAASIVGVGV